MMATAKKRTGVEAIVPIDITAIDPHPDNDRFELGDNTEMAASVKAVGVLQPLTVVPAEAEGRYLLVAGHRRLDAARTARLATVPCQIRADLDTPEKQRVAMLVENVHRRDLSPVEEARAYERLHQFAWPIDRIAKETGRSKGTVRARLRLVRLNDDVLTRIHHGQISLDQADTLVDFVGTEWYPRLEKALDTAQWRWELQECRHARQAAVAVKKARRTLTTQNAIIINDRADLTAKDYARLATLVDATSGARLDPNAHASCPGHAGHIHPTSGDIELCCIHPQEHGHLREYEYEAKQRQKALEAARAAATAEPPSESAEAPSGSKAEAADDDGDVPAETGADAGTTPEGIEPDSGDATAEHPAAVPAPERHEPPNLSAKFVETELQVNTAAALRREHLRQLFADRNRRDTVANWLLVNAMLRDEDFSFPGNNEIALALNLLRAKAGSETVSYENMLGLADHHPAAAAALMAASYETTLTNPRWLEAWTSISAVIYVTWLRRTGYQLTPFEQELFDDADPDRPDGEAPEQSDDELGDHTDTAGDDQTPTDARDNPPVSDIDALTGTPTAAGEPTSEPVDNAGTGDEPGEVTP